MLEMSGRRRQSERKVRVHLMISQMQMLFLRRLKQTDKRTLGEVLGVVPNERLCVVSAATDPSPEELLRQLQEERTCKVCMDKLVSIVFIPCGHLVVCGDCAASLRHCPICRAVIRGSVRAFMS